MQPPMEPIQVIKIYSRIRKNSLTEAYCRHCGLSYQFEFSIPTITKCVFCGHTLKSGPSRDLRKKIPVKRVEAEKYECG